MNNGIGLDRSGKGNNWTTNNLAIADVMLDTPTNNFATWNPLNQSTGVALREGNTNMYLSSNDQASTGTFGIDSGKWYVEAYYPSGDNPEIGLLPSNQYLSNRATVGANSYEQTAFITNGGTMRTGSWATTSTTGLSAQTGGGVIGIAIDADNDKMWFTNTSGTYFNSGNPATGSNPQATFDSDWVTQTGGVFFYSLIATGSGNFIISNFGQDSSFAGNVTVGTETDDNGYGSFKYDVPTGFLALCTKNLPDPAVIPSEHFNVVTYAGTGSSNTQTAPGITGGVDFLWTKCRSTAGKQHILVDDIRGGNNNLMSDSTEAENSNANRSITLADTSFTLNSNSGHLNESGKTYVSWMWKANGTGASNTNGSITSTVSANADAGFSIVKWNGTGSTSTIGHGLSSAPEMWLTKRLSGDHWFSYHHGFGIDSHIYLNNTSAKITSSDDPWNSTAATSSVFTVRSTGSVNNNLEDYIAYCFHSVDGYSKVGSYTGNGSSDGTFVYTGFRPAYVMIKRTDGGAEGWLLVDNERVGYNAGNNVLEANVSDAEDSGVADRVDMLSNGFKLNSTWTKINTSGGNYIFLSFAESPFKHTNAR